MVKFTISYFGEKDIIYYYPPKSLFILYYILFYSVLYDKMKYHLHFSSSLSSLSILLLSTTYLQYEIIRWSSSKLIDNIIAKVTITLFGIMPWTYSSKYCKSGVFVGCWHCCWRCSLSLLWQIICIYKTMDCLLQNLPSVDESSLSMEIMIKHPSNYPIHFYYVLPWNEEKVIKVMYDDVL